MSLTKIKQLWEEVQDALGDGRFYRGQRKIWKEADTVAELGQRGAQWCRGELGAHPGGYDIPDLETKVLLPVLQRANEAGFFTYQSQPGGAWDTNEGHVEQRAFVAGFLERDQLEGFRQRLEGAGMLVLDSMIHDEPLVRYDGEECGGSWKARADSSMHHISRYARGALADAADLTVIDVIWARPDVLWNTLDAWAASRG